uniref:Uncharacterized protein n=1 Tax=Pseudomonas phage HRDY3 TaxID=3236930 RepID=A0AB39CER1_9VIRU
MMVEKSYLLLPCIGLAVTMWAAWFWKRSYRAAEKESERHARNAANLSGMLEEEREENERLRRYLKQAKARIAKYEGDRDKQEAFQKRERVLAAHAPDIPIVQFDSKTGQWRVR